MQQVTPSFKILLLLENLLFVGSVQYSLHLFAELLSDICYALSEEELISDDSFFAWEKNSKNGIAIKSVTQFFQWLRTSD